MGLPAPIQLSSLIIHIATNNVNNEARANVNIRIYQLQQKLIGLQYDADRATTAEEVDRILTQAREIELLIGF